MHAEVIQFWFTEIEPKSWWIKDEAFDLLIQQRFGKLHQQANAGELFGWRDSAEGSLAEIIILDQFSRNIFRNQAAAFASDPLALALAQTAIAKGFDKELPETKRSFLYLPFMHSESVFIHTIALQLYESLGLDRNLEFERRHKSIVDRFGRYPHRNVILGRVSTAEELTFLQQPGSSF